MPSLSGPEQFYSRRRLLAPAVAVIALIFAASGLSDHAPSAPDIVDFDKIAHFHVYGLIATLLFRTMPLAFESRWRLLAAWCGTALVGCGDEFLQSLNPVRSADAADLLADVLGAALAIALYRWWGWYRRLLETRIWRRARPSPAN